MNIELRRQAMDSNDEKIIYLARNLICDGKTAYDTGFKPFSSQDINTDFKISIRVSSFTPTTGSTNQDVILGCKYEGTLNGMQWPGLYFRNTSSTTFDVGGYNYYKPKKTDIIGNTLYLWRTSGKYYAKINNGTTTTLNVRSTQFDQPLIIGAGLQTNGTYFRYSTCVIDYVRIEYL